MKYLETFIVTNPDLLLFICIIELIIIVALIIYIFQKRNNVRIINKTNNEDIDKWKTECRELSIKVSQLEKDLKAATGKGVIAQRIGAPVHDNKDGYQDADKDRSDQSSYGYMGLLKDPNARRGLYYKGNENDTHEVSEKNEENSDHVEETLNADGTIRTDVIFVNREYKYLEAANAGQFLKLLPSDEKSFFRTWEENGVRKFEFHGNVDNALANINAVFDDVCEIEGKQNGATQIDNVEPGILSSQLKVEKKAIIKLT